VRINLLSYNIRFGGRGRESLLADVIRTVSPDIVVFQEAITPQIIAGLAEATNYPQWAARKDHSIGFMSRLEVAHHEWHYPAGAKHSFLELVMADTEARIFGLHLSAMFSKWSERRRAREIRALLNGIKRYSEGFHVLVGDFNALAPGELLDVRRMRAWIRGLIWLSGRKIQRETIQIMLDATYIDCFRFLHPEKEGYTFPTWDPHLRLDYAFLLARDAEHLLDCRVIDLPAAATASDHFPLAVNFISS
jgi:endonuclease/exonuclease/phosphatase family metal-dependent hydrolase